MRIAMIAAMANNRVIGKDNQMPWYLPEDLKHFKAMTMGKPVVMGRKTFESIGKPLPGRHNIVISRNSNYQAQGISLVACFDDAKAIALSHEPDCKELIVMGGGLLYQALLPQADKLYLTEINLNVEGDTWFPKWNDGSWHIDNGLWQTSAKGLEYRFLEANKKAH